ncbi:calcium homeostasis modulator 1-like protein [Labeo rohita]|uniref:Calcium homeostasis modulator 1-like protein n=1 Tax=Labeo rohita TaxID=84645 RepID=A0A498P0N0_LABRO|nr:calcium homeostasis modulator 1-like protein [Labeo rohita]RXN37114.1 calcium homeostasis modulator 1-like protein [Labeo rohita]
MDKFRIMVQFLQANQESFMNGICGIMALASAQMYSSFEFTCPCLPDYNYAYGIGILIVPPIWFFLLGYVLNNNISVLTEEWKRPVGKRRKDPAVLRYMFSSMTQRALIAPAVWVAVTLMDGKSFLCAFSATTDLSEFINETYQSMSKKELRKLQARIPCKDVFDGNEIISREAATRYIRCLSQACGWTFLMVITVAAFLIRAIRPCFTQAAFLKTKYWSHYIDTERKLFDETCKEHAKSFAKVCIQQYFESISGEIVPQFQLPTKKGKGNKDEDGEKQKSDEEKLLGVRKEEDMNRVLWNWHTCKPALLLNKRAEEMNGHAHLDTLSLTDERHNHTPMKTTAVAYYSKV